MASVPTEKKIYEIAGVNSSGVFTQLTTSWPARMQDTRKRDGRSLPGALLDVYFEAAGRSMVVEADIVFGVYYNTLVHSVIYAHAAKDAVEDFRFKLQEAYRRAFGGDYSEPGANADNVFVEPGFREDFPALKTPEGVVNFTFEYA